MSMLSWLFRMALGRRLPKREGKISVPGLRSAIRIHRDQWDVPCIEAGNDHDAWLGLGFCHGQDRTFQLDMLLRIERGRIAELIGAAGLPIDRLSRRIGFYHASCEQMLHLGSEVKAILDAYAKGINLGMTKGRNCRSHEHVLLRNTPIPWSGADVLALTKLQSFLMAANWDAELARLAILQQDGPEALMAVDPQFTGPMPLANGSHEAVSRLAEEIKALQDVISFGGGSNNWALPSGRTSTGRPLLANDPHLNATIPSSWYLAHLETPDWKLAGASFVGTPTFPAGHNAVAAWGITAGLGDVTDLFLEELGDDPQTVREGDDYVVCPLREEAIQVRGGTTVIEKVLVTPRGPIISPALVGEWQAISLCATWLQPLPIEGLFGLHRVQSFQDFRRVMSQWPAGTMNMVYADVQDTVGWQFVGRIPRRRGSWGMIPQPGWLGEHEWQEDPVPFEEMPYREIGPNDSQPDFVVTANADPSPQGTGPFLGRDWMNSYRQDLLREKLGAASDWDVEQTLQLQQDVESLPWRFIRDTILDLPVETEKSLQAMRLLREWNGHLTIDSVAASIFELFIMELSRRTVAAKAPNSSQWALGKGFTGLTLYNFFSHRRVGHLTRLIQEQPEEWFQQSWTKEMVDVFHSVIEKLEHDFGSDMTQWAWGQLRPLTPRHPFSLRSQRLGKIFNLPKIPLGGDTNTIAQATVHPLSPLAGAENTASLRAVMDVGNWSGCRFAYPGGQSGNPCSSHYGDLYPIWQQGNGISLSWTPEEISASTRTSLLLEPERERLPEGLDASTRESAQTWLSGASSACTVSQQ